MGGRPRLCAPRQRRGGDPVRHRHGGRAAGDWQTLTFTGDWDLDGSDQVGIRFLEDSYAGPGRDRNLYVDEVRLNGEVNGADRTFLQAGTETWDF